MIVEEEIDDRVEMGKSRDIRSELASVDLKKQTTPCDLSSPPGVSCLHNCFPHQTNIYACPVNAAGRYRLLPRPFYFMRTVQNV